MLTQEKNHITQIYNRETIPNFDFKKAIKIEMFGGLNRPIEEKQKAAKIIEKSDLLQYHYFSQEYNVVRGASQIFLIYLMSKSIKHLIGFVSIAQPTITKKVRNIMYGKNFLDHIFHIKNTNPKFQDIKFFNLSRMVILPSFRGIGISKFLQDEILQMMKENNPGHFSLEFTSNMFHTIDFASNKFNKTTMKIDPKRFPEVFAGSAGSAEEKSKNIKGYKGETKYIGVVINYFFDTDLTLELFQEYFMMFYGINLSKEQIRNTMNKTIDITEYGSDELLNQIIEKRNALFLLNFMTAEELLKVEKNQIDKKQMKAQLQKEKEFEVEEW